jgi:capsid protein
MGAKLDSVPVDVRNSDGIRQLFHVYNSKRMNQTRGVTALAPIFSLAGMFEDIQFAKLVQQQVVSCFAVFREQAVVAGGGLPTKNADYGAATIETSASGTRYIENIAPGMEIIGKPGEKLQGFSPNVPNAEYFTHVKLMLQMIGVNLGLPLCLVLMDGSETNFSGWRGAVDEARKGFRSNQRNLVNRLHKPVYRWKLSQWIAEDSDLRTAYKELGNQFFNHKWNAPRWSYIDPVGDAQGDQLRLQNGLTSPRRLHAERGAEWEEISNEIVEDMMFAIRAAKSAAIRLNSEFDDGQPVQWRELINLPMPIGVQMTMQDPKALTLQERDQAEVTSV